MIVKNGKNQGLWNVFPFAKIIIHTCAQHIYYICIFITQMLYNRCFVFVVFVHLRWFALKRRLPKRCMMTTEAYMYECCVNQSIDHIQLHWHFMVHTLIRYVPRRKGVQYKRTTALGSDGISEMMFGVSNKVNALRVYFVAGKKSNFITGKATLYQIIASASSK